MATQAAEMTYLLNTILEDQYPGTAEVAKYFNANTMVLAATLPSPQDQFLKYLVMRILNVRNASDSDMFADMSITERQDLVDDVIRKITADQTLISSLLDSLAAYRLTIGEG